jgi:hypothetical protein
MRGDAMEGKKMCRSFAVQRSILIGYSVVYLFSSSVIQFSIHFSLLTFHSLDNSHLLRYLSDAQ